MQRFKVSQTPSYAVADRSKSWMILIGLDEYAGPMADIKRREEKVQNKP
jgi:hypothetical protein